jgi:hypothetical protein
MEVSAPLAMADIKLRLSKCSWSCDRAFAFVGD